MIICAGRRIDASQEGAHKLLRALADRLIAQKDWQAYAKIKIALDAGSVERSRRIEATLKAQDDPGAKGTHTRAEAYDAAGRVTSVGGRWQRKSAKGCKAHIDRKRTHAERWIADKALRALWDQKYLLIHDRKQYG